jgi:rhamnogalacturonyl hydrolase YesR
LGLINPQTQGACLVAKWIIRVANGEEACKILVRHQIKEVAPLKKWKDVCWLDKLLMAPFFKIRVSFPLQSIRKS